MFQSESGKSACRNCSKGTYRPEAGASSCSPCPIGRAVDIEMAKKCEHCTKGRYQSAFGATDCVDCQAGRYQKKKQMAFCDACTEGYWSKTGWNRCLMCAEGYWYRGYYEAVATFAAKDAALDSENTNDNDMGLFDNDNDIGLVDDVDDGSGDDDGALNPGKKGPGCVSCGVPKVSGAYCGGGLCLPVPQRGFWSQGVDSSSDDFNIVGSYIYVCRSKGCTGAPTLDEGCYSDWHIESYPDLSEERSRRLHYSTLIAGDPNDTIDITIGNVFGTSTGRRTPLAENGTNVTVYDGVGRTVESAPTDKDNICSPGAFGPLCQACLEDWFFDTNEAITCRECTSSSVLASLPSIMAMLVLGWIFKFHGVLPLPEALKKKLHLKKNPQLPFMGVLTIIPAGQLKVIWSTIQIVQSVGKNLGVSFPGPMVSFNKATSALNLDFLNVDCSDIDTNFHDNVYTSSAFPLVVVGLIWLSYWVERGFHAWKVSRGASFTLKEESHFRKALYDGYFATTLTTAYMFLPTSAMSQFKGMNCFSYEASTQSYLKADSSIDCNGVEHQAFIFYNAFLILCTQSVIIVFFYILYSNLEKIKPVREFDGDMVAALRARDLDRTIDHIRFLFNDTRVNCWYHEIFDMYRRMFFIGVLPLTSEQPVTKAYIGAAAAMTMTIYFREFLPSRNPFTNLLAVVAQYQILFVFLAALFMLTAAINKLNISEVALGALVFFANTIVVAGAIYAGWLASLRNSNRIKRHERKIAKIEYSDQDDEMFASTLESISETTIMQSAVLAYHYTSMAAAKHYVKFGIPAFNTHQYNCWSAARVDVRQGVVFSLKGPHEIKHDDPCLEEMSPLSSCREAVLCVAVPRELLWPVIEPSMYDDDGDVSLSQASTSQPFSALDPIKESMDDEPLTKAQKIEALNHLVVVPMEVLTAFRPSRLDKEEVNVELKSGGTSLKKRASMFRGRGTNMKNDIMLAAAEASNGNEGPNLQLGGYETYINNGFDSKYDFDLEMEGIPIENETELGLNDIKVVGGAPGDAVDDDDIELQDLPGLEVEIVHQPNEVDLDKVNRRGSVGRTDVAPPIVFACHNIVRGFQLVPDEEVDNSRTFSFKDLVCPEIICDLISFNSQFDRAK